MAPAPASRVVVTSDGSLGGIATGLQLVTVRLPALERGPDLTLADADASLAFVGGGATPMLAILGRDRLRVVDPTGDDARVLGELAIEPGGRILAVTRAHVVLATPSGPAVVTGIGGAMALARLHVRGTVDAAGPSSRRERFIISVGGALEEWSPDLRAPLRRFRLERPIVARFVGGNDRHMWLVPEAAPNEVLIVPLAGGRPLRIELPEPAAAVVDDVDAEQLIVIGATSRALVHVRVAERAARVIHAGPVDDAVWSGAVAVLCAHASVLELIETAVPAEPARAPAPAPTPTQSAGERLSAWKQRARAANPGQVDVATAGLLTPTTPSAPSATPAEPAPADAPSLLASAAAVLAAAPAAVVEAPRGEVVALHAWRDAIALWARRSIQIGRTEPPLLAAGPLHDVALRLGLGDEAPALWLVYGARLCGLDGVAPIDLANVLPRRWRDALGGARAFALGAFATRRNRVDLVPEIAAVLDEHPPRFGTVVDSALVAPAASALVAPPTVELADVAARAAAKLGALLAPTARGLAHPQRFALEARARGLAALVPPAIAAAMPPFVDGPATIHVVADVATANALGLAPHQ